MEGFELFRYLPLAFVAFGVFFAANGVRALMTGRRFDRAAHRAEGTVVDVRSRVVRGSSSSGSRSRTVYMPVVRFAIPDGRTVETEAGGGSSLAPVIGSAVTVLYDPAEPTRVRLEGVPGAGGTLVSAFHIVFGLVFALLGLTFFGGFSALAP